MHECAHVGLEGHLIDLVLDELAHNRVRSFFTVVVELRESKE